MDYNHDAASIQQQQAGTSIDSVDTETDRSVGNLQDILYKIFCQQQKMFEQMQTTLHSKSKRCHEADDRECRLAKRKDGGDSVHVAEDYENQLKNFCRKEEEEGDRELEDEVDVYDNILDFSSMEESLESQCLKHWWS